MIEKQIAEFVPFLSLSYRPEVRLQALQIVEGLTASPGLESLLTKYGAIPFLVRMIGDPILSQKACNSLINLFGACSQARLAALETEVVERLMDLLRNNKNCTDLAVMALVNITTEESACKIIFQEGGNLKGLYLRRLMQYWTSTLVPDVFVNLAQFQAGRELLMSPAMQLTTHLAVDLGSTNVQRRRSALRLIRNLAFDVKVHDDLLSDLIVIKLLLPLIGPEPMQDKDIFGMLPDLAAAISSDKKRDPDRESRMLTIQILGMFLKIHKSRRYFKQIQLYSILRDLHLSEDERDEEIIAAIEDLIPYLVADDPLDKPRSKVEEILD